VADKNTTTNHQREWQLRAAAGNKNTWGQRSNKGINDRTMAGNNKSGRWTTAQQPTIAGNGKGRQRLATRAPGGSVVTRESTIA
jgi:hypothetical protein